MYFTCDDNRKNHCAVILSLFVMQMMKPMDFLLVSFSLLPNLDRHYNMLVD